MSHISVERSMPTPQVVVSETMSRARWWPALATILFGVCTQVWIWFGWTPDRTIQTIYAYMAGLPLTLVLGLWWLFFSRLPWQTRWRGIATGFVGLAVLAACVRIDHFTGEVFPVFTWRWTPHREAVAAAYFEQQAAATPATGKDLKAEPEAREVPPLPITDADWPEYRGRLRDGIVHNVAIRTDWEAHAPQALWRHPVGLGWSSFAVVDGLAFTQEQRNDQEAIVCYDVQTGRQLWLHQDTARFSEALGGDGPRATPTIHDGRLYALGATGLLNCLDARTGQKIWSHDVLVENSIANLSWGQTASPLVYDNVVVINAGGTNQQGLMAFDRVTGKLAWSAGTDVASYASPQLNVVDGVQQILMFDGVGIAGHDPATGRQLWKHPWTTSPKVNGAQPFVTAANQVLVSSGYGVGSILLEVQHRDDAWSVTPVWQSKRLRLKFNSGVLQGDHVYGLDEGVLACVNVRDASLRWKGGRYGFGQTLLVDKWLLILAESGELVVVKAVPDQFTEVARFQAINGRTWNNPVLWKGLLLVRNGDEAACYDLRPAN